MDPRAKPEDDRARAWIPPLHLARKAYFPAPFQFAVSMVSPMSGSRRNIVMVGLVPTIHLSASAGAC